MKKRKMEEIKEKDKKKKDKTTIISFKKHERTMKLTLLLSFRIIKKCKIKLNNIKILIFTFSNFFILKLTNCIFIQLFFFMYRM